MTNRICFFHTDTNGLHQTNEKVSKKNLYCFARLVALNYEIGYVIDNEYIIEKSEKIIIKPTNMYITEETVKFHGITNDYALENGILPSLAINKFKDDIKKVNIFVSHNIDFHLKTILAEAVKYNITINFTSSIIIDTISFYHDFGYIKIKNLAEKLIIKNIDEKNILELIRTIFFRLYYKFEKNIKKQNIKN